MAEPKKRTNKSKTGMRRMHDKVNAQAISYCEKCFAPKKMHTVCYNCGTYGKEAVLDLEKPAKKEAEETNAK
jgi:large subunit ribosomal protein L32